ncbi:MAG: hypothetical protein SF123_11650 [Chloroflexota bacterium]|nr:hypothetical protein [Chloroflexota bacterium]
MFDNIKSIDWKKEGFEDIPYWLQNIRDGDEVVKLSNIKDMLNTMIPNPLLDGQVTIDVLFDAMQSGAYSKLVPVVIDLIRLEPSPRVQFYLLGVLEAFLEFCFLLYRIPADKKETYRNWAKSIYVAVRKGDELYHDLLNSKDKLKQKYLSTGIKTIFEIYDKIETQKRLD